MLPDYIMAQQTYTYDVAQCRQYLEDMTIDPSDENVIDLITTWAEEEFPRGSYSLIDSEGNEL